MIWAMIIFACSGHTNAKCIPLVTTYATREECAEAMTIRKPNTNWLNYPVGGYTVVIRRDAMCLPLASKPITAEGTSE